MKKAVALLLVIFMMVGFAGCSNGGASEAPTQEADDVIRIGLSMNTLNNPFFVDVVEGAKKAAEERGIELIVTDAQNQPSKQLEDVENMLQKKLDLVILDPSDSDAIIAVVESANEMNVPVLTIDRKSNGGEVIAHIGFDAILSGNIAGQYLVDQLDGKGKIVEIMGIMGTNVAQDRSKGFNEIMAATDGFEIVAQQAADFDRAKAMEVMENILQANPEIDGVYAANDEMALGALEAIEAAGRLDEITLIGCDAIDPALEKIREGKQEATIAEPPFFLGKNAVFTALDVLAGNEVEADVILDSNLVTSENVDTIVTKE
jgi:ribose transport system substrate-binding protein